MNGLEEECILNSSHQLGNDESQDTDKENTTYEATQRTRDISKYEGDIIYSGMFFQRLSRSQVLRRRE